MESEITVFKEIKKKTFFLNFIKICENLEKCIFSLHIYFYEFPTSKRPHLSNYSSPRIQFM